MPDDKNCKEKERKNIECYKAHVFGNRLHPCQDKQRAMAMSWWPYKRSRFDDKLTTRHEGAMKGAKVLKIAQQALRL